MLALAFVQHPAQQGLIASQPQHDSYCFKLIPARLLWQLQPRDTHCTCQNTTYPGEEAAWFTPQWSQQNKHEKLVALREMSQYKHKADGKTSATARQQSHLSYTLCWKEKLRNLSRMYESDWRRHCCGHEGKEESCNRRYSTLSSCTVKTELANACSLLPTLPIQLGNGYTPRTQRQHHRQHFKELQTVLGGSADNWSRLPEALGFSSSDSKQPESRQLPQQLARPRAM